MCFCVLYRAAEDCDSCDSCDPEQGRGGGGGGGPYRCEVEGGDETGEEARGGQCKACEYACNPLRLFLLFVPWPLAG